MKTPLIFAVIILMLVTLALIHRSAYAIFLQTKPSL